MRSGRHFSMNHNHIDSTILDYTNSGTAQNNVFNKLFPYSYESRNKEMCLLQASIPNTFPNISVELNNRYIYYYWYNTTGGNGSNSNYLPWVVDLAGADGTPSNMGITQINKAIHDQMIINGHYLTDANGVNVFYISADASVAKNKFVFSFTVVPTVLGTLVNHTLAANGSNPLALSASNSGTLEFMQIQFGQSSTITAYSTDSSGTVTSAAYVAGANGAGLQTNLGFTTVTANPIIFPTAAQIAITANTTSPFNVMSDTTPYITSTQLLTLRCNFVSCNHFDSLNSLATILFADTPLTENIEADPQYKLWLPINDGNYTNLMITICDQSGNSLTNMQDHGSVFTVAFRDNESQNQVEQIRGPPGGPLIKFTDQAQTANGFKRLRT